MKRLFCLALLLGVTACAAAPGPASLNGRCMPGEKMEVGRCVAADRA